jgi:hypothetical protein
MSFPEIKKLSLYTDEPTKATASTEPILILPKQEEEEQEKLWKELIDIYDTTDKASYGYATLINKLKQHYTISKKQ